MKIEGKNALVTGAAHGIGAATALLLAERGAAKIVIADIDTAALATVAAGITANGAQPIVKTADMRDPGAVIALLQSADSETGGLDIVHNNAGIMTGPPDFPDTDMAKMIEVIQINLIAMMVGTRKAVELMRGRNAPGVIINTSSVAAFSAMAADPAYSTSKAGILNFTQACAPLHEAFDIRVMAVCPGITDTAIVPHDAAWLQPALQRVKILQPRDIAQAVCDIVTDDSRAGDYVVVQNEETGA